jgi:hypothetical protein
MDAHSSAAGDAGLTDLEAGVLKVAASWWRHPGALEAHVLDTLGISLTRWHQILWRLLDDPRAAVVDPVTVGRWRRVREQRLHARGR